MPYTRVLWSAATIVGLVSVPSAVWAANYRCMGGAMNTRKSSVQASNSRTPSDMQAIRGLFANHTQIRRSVQIIPGGIRAVSESDNPKVATLLQEHVESMYRRLDEERPLTMMSRALPTLFDNAAYYHRLLEKTPKGVVVTETSDDPALVAVIRAHAREVDRSTELGMAGMMPGMAGGMMGSMSR